MGRGYNLAEGQDAEMVAQALQRLSREQTKRKLLADILADITVCRIEGWDWKEYPTELKAMIDGILEGNT